MAVRMAVKRLGEYRSPWAAAQAHGPNENTNGLLRSTSPKAPTSPLDRG